MNYILERLFTSISRVIPSAYKTPLKKNIKFSGREENYEVVTGIVTSMAIIFILLGFLISNYYPYTEVWETPTGALEPQIVGASIVFKERASIGTGIMLGFLTFFFAFFFYFLKNVTRVRHVEKVLPDALFLIASNLKSGVTPYNAVKSTIRKDFGALSEAFEMAINKSLGSKSFSESLVEVGENINSEPLNRSMKLFAAAIMKGSNVGTLLDDLANDIIERQTLKNELVTNTRTNSMFILFMIILGAPSLMAVSIFFVNAVGSIQEDTGGITNSGVEGMDAMGGGGISISEGFLLGYSYVFLLLTGIMTGFFNGVMVEGDGKKGLRMAPGIVLASYFVFFIARIVIDVFLGGMF